MDVWMIVSASPHTLSPFTPIQGQHHTVSHIPTITMSSNLGFARIRNGLCKSYKLILHHVFVKKNCILKKQRCLCNFKIKFQIPPFPGKKPD